MILLFGGTSEGRRLAGYLSRKGLDTLLFVATEYGSGHIEKMPHISVHTGRLNSAEMADFMREDNLVIDATHPYAAEVTKNIKIACESTKARYLRLLRPEILSDDIRCANSAEEAACLLLNTDGNIFISTGSKELEKYGIIDKSRLCVRVLPTDEAREKCEKLGLKNAIYAKGPFNKEENLSHFKKFDIKWLVTKSSGRAGGFEEKMSAARELGINVIVIKRPDSEEGLDYEQAVEYIDKLYN